MTRKSIRALSGLGLLVLACSGGGAPNDLTFGPDPEAPDDPSAPPADPTAPPYGDVAPPPPSEQPRGGGGTNGGGGTDSGGTSGTAGNAGTAGDAGAAGSGGGGGNCTSLCNDIQESCGSAFGPAEVQQCRDLCMSASEACFPQMSAYMRCVFGPDCMGSDNCDAQQNAVTACIQG